VSSTRVRPLRPGHYGVEVTEGADTTTHEVVVDRRLLDDMGLFDDDEQVVVEETIAFLLDRTPADGLDARISLDDVDRMNPDFRDELVARVDGRAGRA
jgi:hypothetical protein